jgi:hypothetical protein
LTSGTAFGISPRSTDSTSSGDASIAARVSRLQLQPSPKSFQAPWSRSCQRASPVSGERTLQEEHPAPGAQDPGRLGERSRGVRDRAQDQRENRRVEAVLVEGEPLGAGLDDLRRASRLREPGPEPPDHVRVGLRQDQLADGIRVVLQVEARAGSEVDRSPGRAGEQSGAGRT